MFDDPKLTRAVSSQPRLPQPGVQQNGAAELVVTERGVVVGRFREAHQSRYSGSECVTVRPINEVGFAELKNLKNPTKNEVLRGTFRGGVAEKDYCSQDLGKGSDLVNAQRGDTVLIQTLMGPGAGETYRYKGIVNLINESWRKFIGTK